MSGARGTDEMLCLCFLLSKTQCTIPGFRYVHAGRGLGIPCGDIYSIRYSAFDMQTAVDNIAAFVSQGGNN
ncbi:hypothetical protein V5799_005218 [Amblyomma americanum]|uniref:Uncharacterized protein n=1 Tax=Amblyomma americanum TaxID=6943 RepID=A0AAQ4DZW0_AMBAM